MNNTKKDIFLALNRLGRFLAYRNISDLNRKLFLDRFGSEKVDALFVFGNSLPFTAQLAAKTYLDGLCECIVFSGGVGHSTRLLIKNLAENKFLQPKKYSEADILGTIAIQCGVPSEAIMVERESASTGANAELSLRMMELAQKPCRSILLFQDPLLQLRSYATLKKYVPDDMPVISYAPFLPHVQQDLSLENDNAIWGMWTLERYIELVIGEIPRIRDDKNGYGPLGKNYQIHIDIPDDVEEAHSMVCKAYPQYSNRLL